MIQIAAPQIGKEEISAAVAVLKSRQLVQGPKVEEFEKRFSEFIGCKHAIATSSGTTALHLALLALGIKEGDEVITTPFSFIASSNAVLFCGARPVFVDIEEETFNIDAAKIAEKISPKTKAILPVHLFGLPCNMQAIMKIANENNLLVLEDACQAHGAEFGGKKVGAIGSAGAFSFYPTKNMFCGEGGMITTNSDAVAEKARLLRQHGSNRRYYHDLLGFNHRMTDIAAAIGLEQLKKLDLNNQKRKNNAEFLSKKLQNVQGIVVPQAAEKARHVWHQFTVRVAKDFPLSRDKLKEALEAKGIQSAIFYPVPIHEQKIYAELGYAETLPVAEKLAQEVLSLPVHPGLKKKDLSFIAKTISEIK